jgi:gluconolactonase
MDSADECNGEVSVFRSPAGNSNGNTVDRQGRLVTCEHSGRRVSRTEYDGSITCIADRYEGKRLNSPNDVIVKSDGSIWFTDPTYGIDSDYEGERAESEIGASYVYRIDPKTGAIRVVADDFVKPNGLAFSPDEKKLYIADTGRTHGKDLPAHIRVFDVREDGNLGKSKVFADSTAGLFDGFRIDQTGRLWSSSAEGVHCLDPDGTLIGKVRVPEVVSNVCFGGHKRHQLFICGTTSLYTVHLHTNGVATF